METNLNQPRFSCQGRTVNLPERNSILGTIAEACTMLPLKPTRTWRRVCHGKIMGKWEFMVIFRFLNGRWWDFRRLSLYLSNISYRPVEISPKNQETTDFMGFNEGFFWREYGLPHQGFNVLRIAWRVFSNAAGWKITISQWRIMELACWRLLTNCGNCDHSFSSLQGST